MPKVTVLAAAPTAAPEALPGSAVQLDGPGIDVRLKLTAAAAAVAARPWFWENGDWWPLGADGVANVGASPCTADPTKFSRKAHGRYVAKHASLWWCLVLETGAVADIQDAFIDAVTRET